MAGASFTTIATVVVIAAVGGSLPTPLLGSYRAIPPVPLKVGAEIRIIGTAAVILLVHLETRLSSISYS